MVYQILLEGGGGSGKNGENVTREANSGRHYWEARERSAMHFYKQEEAGVVKRLKNFNMQFPESEGVLCRTIYEDHGLEDEVSTFLRPSQVDQVLRRRRAARKFLFREWRKLIPKGTTIRIHHLTEVHTRNFVEQALPRATNSTTLSLHWERIAAMDGIWGIGDDKAGISIQNLIQEMVRNNSAWE